MGKKPRIKIKDLNVNLDEIQKKDPEILKKVRGGWVGTVPSPPTPPLVSGGCTGGSPFRITHPTGMATGVGCK